MPTGPEFLVSSKKALGLPARRSRVQQQISELDAKPEALSTALAQLLPHIQGEECPVCGRDFSEISKEPLVARLSSRISQMTEQATRLESLLKETVLLESTVTAAGREREQITPRRLA